MSITVLSDLVLSNQVIEAGVKGRQMRKNQRVPTANGYESINIVWDRTMREYDVGIGPMRRSAWSQIEALHEVTEGGAFGFLLQDPKDFTVGATEGLVADIGGGYYQLFKRYTVQGVSGRHKDRKITRPLTVQAYVSGAATNSAFDATNGRIQITGNPAASTVTWAGKFYVPVHFLNDTIDWEMVVSGADPDGRFMTGPMVTLQEVRE